MKKPVLKLSDNINYRRFVAKRDVALEKILQNTRFRITEQIDLAFVGAIMHIKARYKGFNGQLDRNRSQQIDNEIHGIFDNCSRHIAHEVINMRKKVYMLSYAGESQAISQVLGLPQKIKADAHTLAQKSYRPLASEKDTTQYFQSVFSNLRRKILSSIDRSLILGDTEDQAVGRVYRLLPKKKPIHKKRTLKKVRSMESAKPPKFTSIDIGSTGINISIQKRNLVKSNDFHFDQNTWNQIVNDYQEDYLPIDRSPASVFDITNPLTDEPEKIQSEDAIYGWEIEQEITHDFVQQVRTGQVDAAKQNGIDDFVWIAVLDDKTCEFCCEWRSGLLTSEIEKRLNKDKELRDHCDAIVPPAHFNCRCALAPASSDLEAVDTSDTDKEFDEWLNN